MQESAHVSYQRCLHLSNMHLHFLTGARFQPASHPEDVLSWTITRWDFRLSTTSWTRHSSSPGQLPDNREKNSTLVIQSPRPAERQDVLELPLGVFPEDDPGVLLVEDSVQSVVNLLGVHRKLCPQAIVCPKCPRNELQHLGPPTGRSTWQAVFLLCKDDVTRPTIPRTLEFNAVKRLAVRSQQLVTDILRKSLCRHIFNVLTSIPLYRT